MSAAALVAGVAGLLLTEIRDAQLFFVDASHVWRRQGEIETTLSDLGERGVTIEFRSKEVMLRSVCATLLDIGPDLSFGGSAAVWRLGR